MSTRISRRFEMNEDNRQGFHLYDECFDDDGNVYLELKGFEFEATTSGLLSGDGVPNLTVKLPLAWAEKLGLIQTPGFGSAAGREGGDSPEGGADGL